MSGVFSGFGLDQLSSRLVGMIFLDPKEISMEELAKRTGYSLASVSNKLKMLEMHQMVVRVRKPGTKKAFYFIEKDVHAIMRRKLNVIFDQFLGPARSSLPAMIEKCRKSRMSAEERQKIEIVQGYYSQLLEVEKVFEKIRKDLEK
ncbi:MAG: hypothetical protein KKD17_03400 [Nanoarchaeota archaeon]|nr:hypothetical protein [Nanoarchaeota archaeon]